MEKKLQKPQFIKVKELENAHDGYNVYVRVVSVQHTSTRQGELQIARAVVGDETGVANAFFKGESTKLIQQGEVVAIRNGRIRLIKNHISLEIDIFGRITKENQEIKADQQNNISTKEITRRKTGNRPPREHDRRDYDKPRDNDRPRDYDRQRKFDTDKPRKPREERGDGQGRQRRERRDDRDGEGKRQFRNNNRTDGERPKRQGYQPRRQDGQRPKRQGYQPRRQDDNRPKIQWTKIGAIEPGDEGLNFFAKILSVEQVGRKARVVFGDESGVVKGFVFNDDCIKEGNTVVVFKAEANVNKEHIEINIVKGGKIEESKTKKMNNVDESVNISQKAWIESA